jgi:hypothetical protein
MREPTMVTSPKEPLSRGVTVLASGVAPCPPLIRRLRRLLRGRGRDGEAHAQNAERERTADEASETLPRTLTVNHISPSNSPWRPADAAAEK